MDQFLSSGLEVGQYLAELVSKDGRLSDKETANDLCSQYKLPTLLLLSGHNKEAQALLDNIKKHHMQENGDFLSFPDKDGHDRKSSKFPMSHYWTYMNCWIAMGAHRLGRFDISVPAFKFCKTFFHPDHNLVCVTEALADVTEGTSMDSLMTAHFGLLCLFTGGRHTYSNMLWRRTTAIVAKQPDFENNLYTRVNVKSGEIITTAPPGLEPFYIIKKDSPNQLYFFLGYHSIFMGKLYMATQDVRYLESAKLMLEFALTCHESICLFSFSHKLMYAAGLIGAMTRMMKYRRLAIAIGEYLMSIRTDDGLFCKEMDKIDQLDQSAEIGIWLIEVNSELKKSA